MKLISQKSTLMFTLLFTTLLSGTYGALEIPPQHQQFNKYWDEKYDQYDDFWLQSVVMSAVSKNRTTVNGSQCMLPFEFRGQIWNDCFIVEGKSMCVIENQGLQECITEAESRASEGQGQGQGQMSLEKQAFQERQTVQGESCEFPFEYRGQMHDDCIDLVGNKMCVINGTLHECKKKRVTLDGHDCQFPFTILGTEHNDCAVINGIEACMVDGGMSECIPRQTPGTFLATSNTRRFSVDGRECTFPYFYMDAEYFDCNTYFGLEWCMLEDEWVQCISNHVEEEEKAVGESTEDQSGEMIGSVIAQISNQALSQEFSSIAEAVGNMEELSMLMQILQLTNLRSFLSDNYIQLTLLAPTNLALEAFLSSLSVPLDKLVNHPDIIYQILQYHILPQTIKSENLMHGQTCDTLLEDGQVHVDSTQGVKIVGMFSQANVVTSDIIAGTAVIHIIDNILLPFENPSQQPLTNPSAPSFVKGPIILDDNTSTKDELSFYKSLEDEEVGLEDLTMFMDLAEAAEIYEVVNGDLDGISLLVPTNIAFQKMFETLQTSFEEIIKDRRKVEDLLLYHIIPRYMTAQDVSRRVVLPTLLEHQMLVVDHHNEQRISIRALGSSANIIGNDMQVRKGMIHVLDAVLLPFNSPQLIEEEKFREGLLNRQFSNLRSYLPTLFG